MKLNLSIKFKEYTALLYANVDSEISMLLCDVNPKNLVSIVLKC